MSLRSRAVDATFGVLEGIASLYDFIRGLRRVRQEEPFPLTHRSVQHQQEQIRHATIRPPPP